MHNAAYGELYISGDSGIARTHRRTSDHQCYSDAHSLLLEKLHKANCLRMEHNQADVAPLFLRVSHAASRRNSSVSSSYIIYFEHASPRESLNSASSLTFVAEWFC